ncbi:hypothetical protein NLJ89_g5797 [Agrocybe chaxingu]|uniref:Uncharacterized protein n=1 Tax=Agrocybe chaxingu TaxID=84603 RepID=A0A9W8JZJ5_9AGAR|nr:hypothetical protein NLJ89_g5797 [Agrocybe chaxingu]
MDRVNLYDAENCPCTFATCPSVIADRRLSRLQPRQAVAAVAKDPPDSIFVMKVATATLSDPRYRRAGAGKVFAEHLVTGRSTGERPHWEYPVMGIINVLASILQNNTETQDADIRQGLYSYHTRIVEALLKDFHYLTPTGEYGDNRRCMVAKMLLLFMQDPDMKRTMYDDKTIRLLAHCWLKTSPDGPLRKSATDAMLELTYKKDENGNAPPSDYLERLFKGVEIPNLVSRVNFIIKSKNLLGENLTREIGVLRNLTESWLPFGPKLVEASVHKQVTAAVRRMLKNDLYSDVNEVLSETEMFIQNLMLESPNTMDAVVDLLNNTFLIEMAAEAFKMANKSPPSATLNRAGSFYKFFGNLEHALICKKRETCKFYVTPEYLNAARSSIERIAIPTLISLQEEVGAEGKYLKLWTNLCRLLGISDASIRERYRLDKKCCNLGCPFRNSGTRKKRLEEHKPECSKLAEAPEV